MDDFQLIPGKYAEIIEMTTDAAGNVYAVGSGKDSAGLNHGIIREKLSGSDNWTTILDLPTAASSWDGFYDVAAAPAGDIYVSGSIGSTFTVLKRPVGASNFEVIDSVTTSSTVTKTYGGLTIDAAGNVFAAARLLVTVTTPGQGHKPPTTTTELRGVVRKQTGGIGAFTTLSQTFPGEITAMCSIASGASAGLYAVGWGGTSDDAWVVWKSTNAGNTWSKVDDFAYSTYPYQGKARANGICGDLDGNIYVTGRGTDRVITGGTTRNQTYATVNYLVTRKSSNGGATWTTVDSYTRGPVDSSYNTQAKYGGSFDVGIDPVGNVYTVGVSETSDVNYMVVREKPRGSSTWTTVDEFAGAGNSNLSGTFTADNTGNLFAGVPALYPNGHWIVRSQPAAPSALFSSIPISGASSGSTLSTSDSLSLADDLLGVSA